MKKYLVIGNPINHSLSPKLHNFWIKQNRIDAIYDKAKLNLDQVENLISQVKSKRINGINPFITLAPKYVEAFLRSKLLLM